MAIQTDENSSVYTVLDNGKLIKPSIITSKDEDNNGIHDLGPYFQVEKPGTAGKDTITKKPDVEDWTAELVPVGKYEKRSFIINGLDTRTLCTLSQADKIVDDKLDEFAKTITNNGTIDTFKELIDYAAAHQFETIDIFTTLDKHSSRITKEEADRIAAVLEETTARTKADNILKQNIDSEASAREEADTQISNDLSSEIATRTELTDGLRADLTIETETRISNINALNSRVDTEVKTLNDRVDTEVETINSRVDTEVETINGRVDTEVETINSRIDTEVETINGRIDTEVEDLTEKLAKEKADRIAGDETLQENLKTEADRLDGEIEDTRTTINARIDSEVAELEKADDILDSRITTETNILNTRITTEVETINGRIDTEVETINGRIDTEVETINGRIDTEVETINKTINEIDENLSQEITDRVAAIEAVEGLIADETKNRSDAIEAVKSELASTVESLEKADQDIIEKFNGYYTSEETDTTIDKAIKEYKDAEFNTINVQPKDANMIWQSGVKLGELSGGNTKFLLFKKSSEDAARSFLGGEILAEINNGEYLGHYNVSLTSNGASYYDGCTDGVNNAKLFQCRYDGTKYYGISIPKIETYSNSTKMTFDGRTSARTLGFKVSGNSTGNWVLSLGNGEVSEDISTTPAEPSCAYGNWGYITVKQFANILHIPTEAIKDSKTLGKYYDKGYVFFSIRYDNSATRDPSVCIRDVRISNVLEFSAKPETSYYDVVDSESLLTSDAFEWNTVYVKAEGSTAYNKDVANPWISHTIPGLCRYVETINYEIIGKLQNKPIEKISFFFNGWMKQNDELLPPETYNDSSIYDIVYLNDEDGATSIKDANGESIALENLTEEEKAIIESPYKDIEVKTANGNTVTVSGIYTANTYCDICETMEVSDIITNSQQLQDGLTFQYLPLKNKMIISNKTRIYPFSALDSTIAAFNCQLGLYKLINNNGANFLQLIACTNKGTIRHDANNYLTGTNPGLYISNVYESIMNPAKNVYYIGILSGYRTDMCGDSYWVAGAGNTAPSAVYRHSFDNGYANHNLTDADLKTVLCEGNTNTQLNYYKIANED